jgi:prophage DNA circulation protein
VASIQEMKDALAAEQSKTVELAEKSFQAIDTVTNQANFWLTCLTVVIGVVGLLGLAAVYIGAKREAKRVADSRINSYINSDEGKAIIRAAIEEEVQSQLQTRTFAVLTPPIPPTNEPARFPAAHNGEPKRGGKK